MEQGRDSVRPQGLVPRSALLAFGGDPAPCCGALACLLCGARSGLRLHSWEGEGFGHMLRAYGITRVVVSNKFRKRTLRCVPGPSSNVLAVACASEVQRTGTRGKIWAQNRRVVVESLPRNGRRACDAQPQAEEPERLQILHVRAHNFNEHECSGHRITYAWGGHRLGNKTKY